MGLGCRRDSESCCGHVSSWELLLHLQKETFFLGTRCLRIYEAGSGAEAV